MQHTKKLLFVFGTRPEAIKMAPVIIEAKKNPLLKVETCITGQHKEMLHQVMGFFSLGYEYDLGIMKHGQTLFDITTATLTGLKDIFEKSKPDVVIVQGDTTAAFVGALAAFYCKIKIAHIEAGLRSFDKYAPYPEEINRKLIGTMADFHFAPTGAAYQNLINEKTSGKIFVTGNSVIDSLLLAVPLANNNPQFNKEFNFIKPDEKIILVTCHRRENLGEPLLDICEALREISEMHPDCRIIYPVHLNPKVRETVFGELSQKNNISLIDPVEYPQLVWLMDKSYFVITDSGGIQEEAPALGKPVIVIREVTERMEGVEAGNAVLAGSSKKKIISYAERLLNDTAFYRSMSEANNPYGDGSTAKQIINHLIENI